MNKIENFMLPEHHNRLYTEEAISSVSLVRDVADKINELVDAYNKLNEWQLAKHQEQDGEIRKGILYMKDNLINTLHEMLNLLTVQGFMDKRIQYYTEELEARINEFLGSYKTGSTSADAELIDIRYGQDKYLYPSAGEAVRNQFETLYNYIVKFFSYDGINLLDIATVTEGSVWRRDGVYKTLKIEANNDYEYCFAPVKLTKGKTYYISNCAGASTYILYGAFDSETGTYTGDLNVDIFTVQNYTGKAEEYEFQEYEFTAEKNGYLFMTCNSLFELSSIDTSYIFEGTTRPVQYPKFNEYHNVYVHNSSYLTTEAIAESNILIVSPAGTNGMFDTIQGAIDKAENGDTILILPGRYHEYVTNTDKDLHIVGTDKESCILEYNSNSYDYPPLSIAFGTVSNLTIHAVKEADQAEPDDGRLPYAVHIDFDSQKDKELTFTNCKMVSDWQAAAGIGLKAGFHLNFVQCEFVSNADTVNGAVYFHDNVVDGYSGIANIKFDTCNMISSGAIAIMPTSYGSLTNTTNMTFYRTMIYSAINGKSSACVGVGRKTTGNGWRQYNNFYLTKDSYGNNVDLFNA